MSIDPGLDGTGYAVWCWDRWSCCVPPVAHGVLTAPRKGEWFERAQWYFDELTKLYVKHGCYGTFVEWPNFRPTLTGEMVAARGDLGKLFAIATTCMNVAWAQDGFGYPVPVNVWKGQLPKDVCKKRIVDRLGPAACAGFTTHDWDAVGIGLYFKGHF